LLLFFWILIFKFLCRAGYLIVEKIFEEPLLDYDIAFKDDLTKVIKFAFFCWAWAVDLM